jgi:hypothetical protein
MFNSGNEYNNNIELSSGINIIEIASGVDKLTISSNDDSTIIFGNIDIVTNINKKLDYRITDSTVTNVYAGKDNLNQLLADIKLTNVAGDFYYNIPVQESSSIDLNTFIEDDTLSSPYA